MTDFYQFYCVFTGSGKAYGLCKTLFTYCFTGFDSMYELFMYDLSFNSKRYMYICN